MQLANQIVVSTGAKQSIANVILALVNPGDEVVILGPYWVSYADVVKFAGGIPVIVSGDIDTGFKPMLNKLVQLATKKQKLFYILLQVTLLVLYFQRKS